MGILGKETPICGCEYNAAQWPHPSSFASGVSVLTGAENRQALLFPFCIATHKCLETKSPCHSSKNKLLYSHYSPWVGKPPKTTYESHHSQCHEVHIYLCCNHNWLLQKTQHPVKGLSKPREQTEESSRHLLLKATGDHWLDSMHLYCLLQQLLLTDPPKSSPFPHLCVFCSI